MPTTRAFLGLAERRGIIPGAEDYWQRIVAAAPTANPDITIMMQRRPGAGGRYAVSHRMLHRRSSGFLVISGVMQSL